MPISSDPDRLAASVPSGKAAGVSFSAPMAMAYRLSDPNPPPKATAISILIAAQLSKECLQ